MKKIILSIAAFCIFNNAEAQLTSLTVGSVAPDFTLTDLDGGVFDGIAPYNGGNATTTATQTVNGGTP